MRNFIFLLLSVVIISGCSPLITKRQKENYIKEHCKPEVVIKDSISYIENVSVEYDTVKIPVDSSFIEMFLICDSNNKVLIKELDEYIGKSFETKIIVKDNKIYIKTKLNKGYIVNVIKSKYKEYYSKYNKQTTMIVEKKYIPKILWLLFGMSIIVVWFRKQIIKFIFKIIFKI